MTAVTCQQQLGAAETNEVCIVEIPFFDMTALFSEWLMMIAGMFKNEITNFKADPPFKNP